MLLTTDLTAPPVVPPPVVETPPYVDYTPQPPEDLGPVMAWYPATGDPLSLEVSSGFRPQAGSRGFGSPPVVNRYDEAPGKNGAFFNGYRVLPRDMLLVLLVEGVDRPAFVARQRALRRAFRPGSLGTLEIAESNGSRLRIDARYDGGLDGSYGVDEAGLRWAKHGLLLKAENPLFYGDPIADRRAYDPGTAGWPPFTPWNPAPQRLGVSQIVNGGDESTYPTWTVRGPFTAVTLANGTSGKSLTVTWTATVGQWLTIVTEPGMANITDHNGVSRWDNLTSGSALWPLSEGVNDVTLSLTGQGTGSAVEWTAPSLYWGAL